MPYCARLNKSGGSASGFTGTGAMVAGQTPADVAQTDLTLCDVVLFTGKEWQASAMLANSAMPVQSGSGGQAGDVPAVDPATAGAYFGLAFASTITLWAVAHGAGQLIKFVRRS